MGDLSGSAIPPSEVVASVKQQVGVLLDLPETAEVLGKSVAQLRWMIQTKTAPPSALIGGRRMFRAKDVIAFVDAQFAKETA